MALTLAFISKVSVFEIRRGSVKGVCSIKVGTHPQCGHRYQAALWLIQSESLPECFMFPFSMRRAAYHWKLNTFQLFTYYLKGNILHIYSFGCQLP